VSITTLLPVVLYVLIAIEITITLFTDALKSKPLTSIVLIIGIAISSLLFALNSPFVAICWLSLPTIATYNLLKLYRK